ncbi:Gtr1/RagA G protein region [Trichostrongylus colubriformis]|uniref:Gtr1/RagA G protein region n=1 Tax=Trichostrongylus colubriformis TaxID=6319 RepID=A0AAN8F8C6_TRICO
MEVVAAVAACTLVPIIYTSIRKRLHTKVNCWFCQQNQRVPYEQRDSFVCSNCEQYNGFDESGGYNRKVPGQQCFGAVVPSKRYCTPMKANLARPDVVPREGYSSNGLCEKCNRQQEIIMRKVADFEPLNEERWSEELEMYRYKLNKIYPLCARCTFFTQNRMQEEKVKYAHLIALKNSVASSIVSGINSVKRLAKKATRRRRHFFAGGLVVEILHAVTFVLALLLFISQFNYLQEDAGLDLVRFPMFIQKSLPTVLSRSFHVVGALFCAHVVTMWTNKCRTTLPDLILPAIAAMHLTSFIFPEKIYSEDLALFRCAFACFETLLATAVTFVPRKKISRTRPNRMLSSAFSIASTPASQCSSQATSCNTSVVHDRTVSGKSGEARESLTPNNVALRQRMKWRERQQTPEPAASPVMKIGGDYEDMDWEPSLDRTTTPLSNNMRPSAIMAQMIRESTPSRELAPSLSSLSLFGDEQQSQCSDSGGFVGHRARLSASEVGKNRLHPFPTARSQFSANTSSRLPSIRSLRRDVSPSRSVFSSISQRQEEYANRWATPLLLAFAMTSLVANIVLFYIVFKK